MLIVPGYKIQTNRFRTVFLEYFLKLETCPSFGKCQLHFFKSTKSNEVCKVCATTVLRSWIIDSGFR